MAKQAKTSYVCIECGYASAKWLGRCPSCGEWNTMEEEILRAETSGAAIKPERPAVLISDISASSDIRLETGMAELDRVLGGGLVVGSVVLLSGEPGIGKSTLLLQICETVSRRARVMYVSGEESQGQLKLRADRLGVKGDAIHLLTETRLESILSECERLSPDVVIVDSIQTVFSESGASAAGSTAQVRSSAMALIELAKKKNCSVLLVGHVNKEGGISGPKHLEHMVDAVLCFEGERRQSYRMIRSVKNRYGSTNEIGVFEMGDVGLREVPNPSQMMLDGRPENIGGNCASCIMEGTRPLISDVQALVSATTFPAPRRTANGFDYSRMCLLIAVLEKRLGLKFYQSDVYLNVAGGLRLDEPAADLAVVFALLSGITDRIVPKDMLVFGEVGLSGEVRAVSHAEYRVKEATRLGFCSIVMPKRSLAAIKAPEGVRLIGISSIYEALTLLEKKEVPNIGKQR